MMASMPDGVRLTPRIEMTLGSGWSPQSGWSWLDRQLQSAVHWVINTGLREAFPFFAGKINGLLSAHLSAYLPTVNGRQQSLSVLRVTKPSNSTLNADLSSLVIKLGDFVPAGSAGQFVQNQVIDNIRLHDVSTARGRLSILVDYRQGSAPTD